jgi:hypothetical protein
LKSFVGYDISWSNSGDFLFITTLGGKTTAVDAKTLTVVDQVSLNVDPHTKM